MSDDLRSAIESAVTENEAPANDTSIQVDSTPAAAPVETSSPTSTSEDTSSGDMGGESSSSVSKDAPPSIEEVAGEASKPVEDKSETPEQREARHRVDRAPQSWKGDAKKLWEQLPLQVRQEVARREKDVMQTMQAAAQDRNKVSAVEQAIAPHRDRIQAIYGGNPITAINNLLQFEASMTSAPMATKAQMVANMVKHFGVDVYALDSALAGQPMSEQVQQQSTIEQLLEQKLAPFQQFLQTQQQREQQQRQQTEQQVVSTVEQMAHDAKYPYFEEVRQDMADIVEMNARRGVAISLDDAYTRAVRMNDGTFQAASVRDSTQSATQQALDAHRAAQAAKGASVSVSGSPSSSGRNAGDPSNLRGTIEAAFGGGRL